MSVDHEDLSDFDDDELDNLYQKNINREVKESLVRQALPMQRDLAGNVLPNQVPYYEEIRQEITFRPTHHKFNEDCLGYYVYPTNYEIRDYQFDIVRKALTQNILCAIPTGMGKTFIASALMLNYFRWTTTGKIIFTAPTRPLVAQQIKACLGITGIPHDQTAVLLDKTRRNRDKIWTEKRVFFTTPQVVENDLKRGALDPKDIVCLVIDEAHRATGSYAYTNVVKFINRFNTSYRILALTATPGSDLPGVQEVVSNLNISKIELRTEESMDIVKYMKRKEKERIEVGLTADIEDVIEQLGIAILPILKQAVELGIYDECPPTYINAFKAMQQSQKIIANPTIPEGIKWRNFFILQLLNHVGQMLKRIKIYGLRTFYSYFQNKFKEFTTKYNLGKSTNKLAASFYFHPILRTLMSQCEEKLRSPSYLGHSKLEAVRDELMNYFETSGLDSRVIIFTELRESALEIVKCIDSMGISSIRPHIFIGQARAKEGFDEVEFTRKHNRKGRKKEDRIKRKEEDQRILEERKNRSEKEAAERNSRRTASSEDAQINGMNQKQQKEVIRDFKAGEYNVLVCTSIGEEGLDIGEVDLIICYDTTSSPIKNIQRMGRTGRKRDGKVILLFSSNESSKFNQAMEDYATLQKLIAQNSIEYKKSDRILPAGAASECRKEFINISPEDQEVNEMEDTDELILYATQCMLGKKPKSKTKASNKKRKLEEKSSAKRFFMPDNIETGIISASNLVKKVDTSEIKREPLAAKSFPTLAKLERASFDSLSPVKSDDDLVFLENGKKNVSEPKNLGHILEKSGVNNVRLPSSQDRTFNDLSTTSLGQKIDADDEAEDEINVLKKRKKDSLRAASNGNLKSTPIISSVFKGSEGLLSPQEKKFFHDHYSIHDAVAIEPIPNFSRNTLTCNVSHSVRVHSILESFDRIRDTEEEKIKGEREHQLESCNTESLKDAHKLTQTKETGLVSLDSNTLNEILGSDSDF